MGSSSTLIDQVKRGELDAAFVSRPFALPGLREHQVFTDKLVVLAPNKVTTRNDLFAVNRIGLKVLVQRLGCSYTERLLTFLETRKVRPERIMEMGTLEGVIGFVEAGVGDRSDAGEFYPSDQQREKGSSASVAWENGHAAYLCRGIGTYGIAVGERFCGSLPGVNRFVLGLSVRPIAGRDRVLVRQLPDDCRSRECVVIADQITPLGVARPRGARGRAPSPIANLGTRGRRRPHPTRRRDFANVSKATASTIMMPIMICWI